MTEPLAHSEKRKYGIPAQTYRDHVSAVRLGAKANMDAALRYFAGDAAWLAAYAEWAGLYHDLGKLDPDNQSVLRGDTRSAHLPVNHVDAGSAYMRRVGLTEAALAIYSHHLGLADLPAEMAKEAIDRGALRDLEIRDKTDANCDSLVNEHHLHADADPPRPLNQAPPLSGLSRRLLLSCLVDADHSDTARYCRRESDSPGTEPRWQSRREALERYLTALKGQKSDRAAVRERVYVECRDSRVDVPVVSCESPVGSGKTTAVMAYLLGTAEKLNLRHIFVVLPYTTIIKQSVDVYRRALVLPGEDAESVVAAHHHQAEFSTQDARTLTTLWRAPIIVTTAVQFFQTLSGASTATLRKLHALPGSAVFIDEAHAAMRIGIWPYMWDRMKDLGNYWGCRFVLGSGSLVRFWEDNRIMQGQAESIPSLVRKEAIHEAERAERARVAYRSRPDALTLGGLCNWIMEHSGPRVVVMNTVQSAAVLARELRDRGVHTCHLSTALAPVDRERIFDGVREQLQYNHSANFVLVGTSCIEAGVDLSFAVGFRERSRVSSLIQMGGRVNRHGEWGAGMVWDFVCSGAEFSSHREFTHSRPVVEEVFSNDRWALSTSDVATYALTEEFKRAGGADTIRALREAENAGRYPDVAKQSRIIQTDGALVIVKPEIVSRVQGRTATPKEIRENSVQLWSERIRSLGLKEAIPGSNLYIWGYDYDCNLLGVMSGILAQKAILDAGFVVV